MATLYIIATPIGNLEDITLRALRILKEVDFVLCEDTRVTKKLLSHYEISKPCIAYHQHSDGKKVAEIIELLNQGKNLALVTDAGTPGISDPGGKLVEAILLNPPASPFAKGGTQGGFDLAIVPIPGASALTAALSICGFPTDHFVFMGFPPHKKHRKDYFLRVAACQETVAFYESPYRIIKTLTELGVAFSTSPRQMVVCRELTKMFETVYRGTIGEVLEKIKSDTIKGEFVVIVSAV